MLIVKKIYDSFNIEKNFLRSGKKRLINFYVLFMVLNFTFLLVEITFPSDRMDTLKDHISLLNTICIGYFLAKLLYSCFYYKIYILSASFIMFLVVPYNMRKLFFIIFKDSPDIIASHSTYFGWSLFGGVYALASFFFIFCIKSIKDNKII